MINYGNFSRRRLFAFCRWKKCRRKEKKCCLTQQPPGASFPARLLFTMCIYTIYLYIKAYGTLLYGILLRQFPIYTRRCLLILHSALVDLMPKRNREKKRGGSWRCWRLDQQRSHTAQKNKSPRKRDEYWIRHLLCWFTISIHIRPIRKYTRTTVRAT